METITGVLMIAHKLLLFNSVPQAILHEYLLLLRVVCESTTQLEKTLWASKLNLKNHRMFLPFGVICSLQREIDGHLGI